ncbi:MAG: helix-turn-helix domain-containing protein [Bacteroidales bacterium]|jgi:transcriptional regulator with XRE-family HTH domain
MKDKQYIGESQKLMQHLKKLATEKGLSDFDIADKTGLKPANVFRILSGKYPPSLDYLINIAQAVGYHIEFKEN